MVSNETTGAVLEERVKVGKAGEKTIRVYNPDKEATAVYNRLSEGDGGKEPVFISREEVSPLLRYLFTVEGNREKKEGREAYRETIPTSELPGYFERLREGDKPAGKYVWKVLQSEEGGSSAANDSLRFSLVEANILELRAWAEAGNMDKLEELKKMKEAGKDIAAERRGITHECLSLVPRFVHDYLSGNGSQPPVELVDALKERRNMTLAQKLRDYDRGVHYSRSPM